MISHSQTNHSTLQDDSLCAIENIMTDNGLFEASISLALIVVLIIKGEFCCNKNSLRFLEYYTHNKIHESEKMCTILLIHYSMKYVSYKQSCFLCILCVCGIGLEMGQYCDASQYIMFQFVY